MGGANEVGGARESGWRVGLWAGLAWWAWLGCLWAWSWKLVVRVGGAKETGGRGGL